MQGTNKYDLFSEHNNKVYLVQLSIVQNQDMQINKHVTNGSVYAY